MIPVQYREESTDTILDFGFEPEAPRIGERRCLGRHEYEVLYRWRSGPTSSCVVYVRPVEAMVRIAS